MDFISMDEQEFRLFLCRRFEKPDYAYKKTNYRIFTNLNIFNWNAK